MSRLHSCREVARLLSQSLDEPLRISDRLQLRLHLFLCRNCRHVKSQFAEIQELSSKMLRDGLNLFDDGVDRIGPHGDELAPPRH